MKQLALLLIGLMAFAANAADMETLSFTYSEAKGIGPEKGVMRHDPSDITRSILYAEDGIHFSKTHNVTNYPVAGGAYRPEAFTQSGKGKRIEWGLQIGGIRERKKGFLPFLERFEL